MRLHGMSTPQHQPITRKLCFVTIGATAAFDSLIKATLSPEFLQRLQESGYTDLLLQYGKDGHVILEDFQSRFGSESEEEFGIKITGFDFNKKGLGSEMRAAKGEGDCLEGVVISHAGIKYEYMCFSHKAHIFFRLWFNPRCPPHCSSNHRCTQPRAFGQSPSGIGGRAGSPRLRDPWASQVGHNRTVT